MIIKYKSTVGLMKEIISVTVVINECKGPAKLGKKAVREVPHRVPPISASLLFINL